MVIISEYQSQRRRRDRDRVINATIMFFSIMFIFATVLITATLCRMPTDESRITKALDSCPKGSLVYSDVGQPYTWFKGEKIYLLKRGCRQ